jgi:hypothetical protein
VPVHSTLETLLCEFGSQNLSAIGAKRCPFARGDLFQKALRIIVIEDFQFDVKPLEASRPKRNTILPFVRVYGFSWNPRCISCGAVTHHRVASAASVGDGCR